MGIITLTLSPSIDKTTTVQDLIPEKKLRCSDPVYDPGGGGINVARAIIKLGGNALAVYPSGGCTGMLFDQLLEKEKVPCRQIRTERETRENIIVVEESNGQQYRFGMPGAPLSEDEWKGLLQELEHTDGDQGYLVASGSVPPGVPSDVYARISEIARKKGSRFIVDTSGEALKQAVSQGVFLVKPNLNELGALTNMPVGGTDQIIEAGKELIDRFRCEVVVVSMGGAGALLITESVTEKIPTPQVPLRSTVGAGDSMVAGITLSLANGKSLTEAVRYGVACGTAATMNHGTELCRKDDADKLYQQILELEKVL